MYFLKIWELYAVGNNPGDWAGGHEIQKKEEKTTVKSLYSHEKMAFILTRVNVDYMGSNR